MTAQDQATRSVFSPEISGRIEDGVLIVTIDNPPVNAASATMRAGLFAAVRHADATDEIRATVITGAGRNFVGGADIREFGAPMAGPALPELIALIEASDKPFVAAINGAALGGGLELALACHHRIAVTEAKLGLPEVKLGIVPGAGGTQRLPRLVGTAVAVEMIATGRIVAAAEALSLGIVDRVVPDGVVAAAIAMARELAGGPLRRTGELAVPAAEADAVDKAAAKALSRTRGQKAPGEAVRLVRSAGERALSEGLADERSTFLRLRDSDEAKALRHVFFAERAAAKVAGLEDVAPRPVRTIGVVGTGLMGSGIAVAALDAGYRVIGVEQTAEAATKGRDRIVGLLDRAVASGRLDTDGRAARLDRLAVTANAGDIADADLVIEAVFDDLAVKTGLFKQLDGIVRPDSILATNTSYLDPDVIAAATSRPERVLGLHFFSPANVMRLLEVVRGSRTAPDVLATGIAVARKLGKLPVVSGVCEGFVGNRIFSAYRREAEFMLEDGATAAGDRRSDGALRLCHGPVRRVRSRRTRDRLGAAQAPGRDARPGRALCPHCRPALRGRTFRPEDRARLVCLSRGKAHDRSRGDRDDRSMRGPRKASRRGTSPRRKSSHGCSPPWRRKAGRSWRKVSPNGPATSIW